MFSYLTIHDAAVILGYEVPERPLIPDEGLPGWRRAELQDDFDADLYEDCDDER